MAGGVATGASSGQDAGTSARPGVLTASHTWYWRSLQHFASITALPEALLDGRGLVLDGPAEPP